LRQGLERNAEFDGRALARMALKPEVAPHIAHVLGHVGQAVSSSSRVAAVPGCWREPNAIVPNEDLKIFLFAGNANFNHRGMSMFEDVVQGLLEGEKNVVPKLGGNLEGGQFARNAQPAVHWSMLEILPGVLAQVRGQLFQSVIVRVDGPYHFIQSLEQIP